VHDGIPFGWDTVKLICHYVHSIGKVDETKLCDNAVHPTGRTAMNVGYMKAIFDPKTICFGLKYIREFFLTDQGTKAVEDLHIQQLQLNIPMNGIEKKIGGYAILVETYQRTIFSSSKNYKENRVDRNLVHELKTFIKGLTYMAHFCDLYSELYLNSSIFITRENIDILDNFVKNGVMSYLLKWRREIDDEKGKLETEYVKKLNLAETKEEKIKIKCEREKKRAIIETQCYHLTTYFNTRLLHSAFFHQARQIFKLDQTTKFWPFLFSSQSRLEAEFACVRMKGLDTATLYSTNVAFRNHKQTLEK